MCVCLHTRVCVLCVRMFVCVCACMCVCMLCVRMFVCVCVCHMTTEIDVDHNFIFVCGHCSRVACASIVQAKLCHQPRPQGEVLVHLGLRS